MIFTEPSFLPFFLAVFAVHWALRSLVARKLLLLVASLWFYGCVDWRYLGLIVGCATVDFAAGLGIAAARARGASGRGWLVTSLVYDLGTLGFFKYHDFFVTSVGAALRWYGVDVHDATLGLVLPIGISFFTFQSLSYTLDVWRGQQQPVRSYPDFLLFVTFFPQLVAGPILRAGAFLPQLDTPR